MKKLTALLLVLVLLCSLAGCDRQSTRRTDDGAPDSTAQAEPPRAPGVSDPEEDAAGANDTGDADGAGQQVDLLGSWNGNVYSNAFLGLSYTLPDNWVYASDEELLGMIDLVLDSDIVSDHGKMVAELMKTSIVFGLVAQGPGGDIVQIMFENLENQIGKDQITEERYVESMAAQQNLLMESGSETRTFGETYWAQLGGKDFLVVPIDVVTNSGIEYKQWMYILRVGDWMAALGFTTLSGGDAETMTGGVSAFAPLGGGASGSSGASGRLTATGDIGRTFSTMFFDYTLLSAESPAEYDGYTAQSGNKLILVRVRVKNDFGSTLPMYDTDFPLFWGDGSNGEYSWAVDAFNDDMMPLEWELEDGREAEYDMLFEVPSDKMEFSLSYLEEYTDRNGNDQTGDWYDAYFTLLVSASA